MLFHSKPEICLKGLLDFFFYPTKEWNNPCSWNEKAVEWSYRKPILVIIITTINQTVSVNAIISDMFRDIVTVIANEAAERSREAGEAAAL